MRLSTLSAMRLVAVAAAVGAAMVAPLATVTATAATPVCSTSGLVTWLNTQGSGAAGSTYYNLEFTNLSGHSCTLRGYPGVSAVNLSGQRVGTAASRNTAHASATVTVANKASAHAVVQIADANNYPPAKCQPTTAAGLRVYPPSQSTSKVVPFPFLACSRSGPVYLHVEAIQSGR